MFTSWIKKWTAYFQRIYSCFQICKSIKIHQGFPELWLQTYCHLFMVHSVCIWFYTLKVGSMAHMHCTSLLKSHQPISMRQGGLWWQIRYQYVFTRKVHFLTSDFFTMFGLTKTWPFDFLISKSNQLVFVGNALKRKCSEILKSGL